MSNDITPSNLKQLPLETYMIPILKKKMKMKKRKKKMKI